MSRMRCVAALSVVLTCLVPASAAQAEPSLQRCPVALDFRADGVLPSSQGLTYITGTGTSEPSVFSVDGGLLHMNTLGTGATAGYQDGFDPAGDFLLAFRLKVFAGTGPFGVDFEVSAPTPDRDFEFGFVPSGVFLPPSPIRAFLPFDTASSFHTYAVVVPGGSTSWRFFIDGRLRASGSVSGGDVASSPRLIFGDLTTGADGRMDVDFLSFCQSQDDDD